MITAKSNHLQRVRRLSNDRRTRREEGAFVVEGHHLVAEAVALGLAEEVYVEPGAEVDGAAHAIEVEPGALAKVTDAVTSQGVAAVVRLEAAALGDVPAGAPLLVLAGLGDPGNAGTLLRTAEAAGFGAVLCTKGSVDPWSPKCVRASAGAVLRVPVIEGEELATVLQEVAGTGRRRVGTRAHDAEPYDRAEIPTDVALVLGNEAHGLPAGAEAELDGYVSVPMAGRVESLNVAMAGTVLCFEVARRRRAAG